MSTDPPRLMLFSFPTFSPFTSISSFILFFQSCFIARSFINGNDFFFLKQRGYKLKSHKIASLGTVFTESLLLECDPWIISKSITWKQIRHAESEVQPHRLESVFNTKPQVIYVHIKVREVLCLCMASLWYLEILKIRLQHRCIFVCMKFHECLFVLFRSLYPPRVRTTPNLLLLFGRSVMSNSLQPHGQQHTKLPCPLQPPRICSSWCQVMPSP